MSKPKLNALEKLAILQEIESGHIGRNAAVRKYGFSKSTVAQWQRRYHLYGYEGLEIPSHNRSYSEELKHQAVMDYLGGGLSQYQIIEKYKIASRTQLTDWIKKYNGHSSLKAYTGGTPAMTKGRSTTWQERIDIVLYCLALAVIRNKSVIPLWLFVRIHNLNEQLHELIEHSERSDSQRTILDKCRHK
ncbi:helix-turn-helix domain-containing protein [Paenibacillus nasutitermitis]|uniref:Insertion element IS150 protein InsJ-like helix-turn-helix domain-containing protein n=1 Tax=Paenibacillus nasutitermitis TaxID=1652958 RepID=A0A916YUI9_9BACL|nr:helix-turn-helix domain-containing protein [Paenibacillus nasutitermitis]GGD60380.1 hypothetical protein GCM10010911_17840 [Paenibacillus nasutitermitis]